MNVDPCFLTHWRTQMLVDALGGDKCSPIYVLRLWGQCQLQMGMRFSDMPASGLKAICIAPGDSAAFEAAMVEAGFVVRNGAAIEVQPLLFRLPVVPTLRPDLTSSRWKALRLLVLVEQGTICAYCGDDCSDDPTVDHVIPVSQGADPFDAENLVVACRPCNSRKGAKMPEVPNGR